MGAFLTAFEPVIIVIHFIMAFFLIAVILLQAGKGTDIGAVFGAGARAVVGTSGRGDWLTKLTAVAAVVFLATSLSLATISKVAAKGQTESVLDKDVSAVVEEEKTTTQETVVPEKEVVVEDKVVKEEAAETEEETKTEE